MQTFVLEEKCQRQNASLGLEKTMALFRRISESASYMHIKYLLGYKTMITIVEDQHG